MFTFLKRHRSLGFTMVEVLVVTSIIGLLSGVVAPTVNNAREGARDDARKADLSQIQTAVRLAQDSGTSLTDPDATDPVTICNDCGGDANTVLSELVGDVEDPRHDGSEYYYYFDPDNNQVCAKLEREEDDYCVGIRGRTVASNSPPAPTYSWQPTGSTQCSVTCGNGNVLNAYECQDNSGNPAPGACTDPEPAAPSCNEGACTTYSWQPTGSTQCSVTCGNGNVLNAYECQDNSGNPAPGACTDPEPAAPSCNEGACTTYSWQPTGSTQCSVTCGNGNVLNAYECQDNSGNPAPGACTDPEPAAPSCNEGACCDANEGNACWLSGDPTTWWCRYGNAIVTSRCVPAGDTPYCADEYSYGNSTWSYSGREDTGQPCGDADEWSGITQCDGTCVSSGPSGPVSSNSVVCDSFGFVEVGDNMCVIGTANRQCPYDAGNLRDSVTGRRDWELVDSYNNYGQYPRYFFPGFSTGWHTVCEYEYDVVHRNN